LAVHFVVVIIIVDNYMEYYIIYVGLYNCIGLYSWC